MNKNKINPLKESKEEKPKLSTKGYIIGLAISFGVTIVIGVIIFLIRYYSSMVGESKRLPISLIDAFSLSGLLGILFFFIVWVSNYGAFDAISYSILVAWNTVFHKNIRETKVPKTYHEYRELKRGKERLNTTFMLFPSVIFLIVGIILNIVLF